MSIEYTYAQDHLQNEALHVGGLDLVLNLPENEDHDEIFFGRFQDSMTERYISGMYSSQRIKYYSIFNKISQIMTRNIQGLTSCDENNHEKIKMHKQRLLKCLVCEYDIIKVCKDFRTMKIMPAFLGMLEYVNEFDHLVTIYNIAALHFRRMDLHLDDVKCHTSIIFHAASFMKLFETYNYDAALMYRWLQGGKAPKGTKKHKTSVYEVDLDKSLWAVPKPDHEKKKHEKEKEHNSCEAQEVPVEKKSLVEDLQEKFSVLYTYGKEVLDLMKSKTLTESITPKLLADELIEKHNLQIEAGSYKYSMLIAEIVIAHYIVTNNPEELLVLFTVIQSFYGNFYLNSKVSNKNQKQLGFLVYELHSEFQPLPAPFIIDVVQNYFLRIHTCETEHNRIKLMKYLDALLSAISFALCLVTHLPPSKSKPRYNFILQRLFLHKVNEKTSRKDSAQEHFGKVKKQDFQSPQKERQNSESLDTDKLSDSPNGEVVELYGYEELKSYSEIDSPNDLFFKASNITIQGLNETDEILQKPEFLVLFELGLGLMKTLKRNFDDPSEIKTFTMYDKYQNYEYFPHNIFENLLQILFGVSEELKAKGEQTIFEINGILAGCRLIERTLDHYFLKSLENFTFFDNYITCRELDICVWWIWWMKERPQNQFYEFLILCFKKLDELVRISLEESFFDRIRDSGNPKALLAKQNCFLKFLNKNSIIVFKTAELYESKSIQKFREILLNSDLIDFLVANSDNWPDDWVAQDLLRCCVDQLLEITFMAKYRYPENGSNDRFVEIVQKSNRLMFYKTSKYQQFELSCVLFQIFCNDNIVSQAYRLIPEFMQKIFFEILPDVTILDDQLQISILNFLLPPIFASIDISKQSDDPTAIEASVNCILGYVKRLGDYATLATKEFLDYDFNRGLADQKLRNETILAKLITRMLRFAKLCQQIIPHFHFYVNILNLKGQEADLEKLSYLINTIILSPILQLLAPHHLEYFFQFLKDVYNINSSAFRITMTNMLFNYFIKASQRLTKLFKSYRKGKDTRIAKAKQFLGKLLERPERFWNTFNQQQVEAFETLDQKVIFALFTIETVHQFVGKYLVDLTVSADTLSSLASSYEEILNASLDLTLICKFGLVRGLDDSSNLSNYTPGNQSLQQNLFVKLALKHITPLLIMSQPEALNKSLESFIKSNLNVDSLLELKTQVINEVDQGQSPLYYQVCAFELIVNLFIEGQSFFDAFITQDKLLQPILDWVSGIILQYKSLIAYDFQKIYSLDSAIGLFIRLANSCMEKLSQQTAAPNNHTGTTQSKFNEKFYIKFLHKVFQGDFSCYENCYPDSETLNALSQGVIELALRMLDYRQLHNSGDFREDDELDRLRNTETGLKEPHFFEDVYLVVKEIIRKGMNSTCFSYFLLQDKECLELFEGTDAHHINTWIQKMYMETFNAIKKKESLSSKTMDVEDDLKANEVLPILNEKDLFKCLKILQYTMEKPARVMSMFLEASEGQDSDFLDDPQEVVKNFLETFSLNEIKALEKEPFFVSFITNYSSLLVNLYKKLEMSLIVSKGEDNRDPIDEKTQLKIQQYFELAVTQFRIQSFLRINPKEGLKVPCTAVVQELYLFCVSLWWYGEKTCLEKVVDEPEIIGLLFENAEDEVSLELLSSFLGLYAINAFPLETQLEFLLKGLRQAGIRGIKTLKRIRAFKNLINPQVIENLETRLIFTDHTLNEDAEFANTRSKISRDVHITVTGKDGQNRLVKTHKYFLNGVNNLTKKAFDGIFHVYLQSFAQEAIEVSEGRTYKGKVLRPYFLIALMMKKFPELSLYILSYKIDLQKYNLKSWARTENDKITFIDFIIRTNFLLFPGFCMMQETVCSNLGQFIAVQFSDGSDVKLVHETLVQLFLEETLNVMQTVLVGHEKDISKNPRAIWKWGIYLTKALDVLFSYSSPRYMELPTTIVERYLTLLVKYIALISTKQYTTSEVMMTFLLNNLQKLIEISFIQRYNSIVGKFKSKSYLFIPGRQKGTSKIIRFLSFIAKKNSKDPQRHHVSRQKSLKELQLAEKQELLTFESVLASADPQAKELENISNEGFFLLGPQLRQSKWWSQLKNLKTEREEKLLDAQGRGFFEDIVNIHNQIAEEIDSFADKTPEVKEFRRKLEAIRTSEKASFYWTKKCIRNVHQGWGWEIESMKDHSNRIGIEKLREEGTTTTEEDGEQLFKRLLKRSLKNMKNDGAHPEDGFITFSSEEGGFGVFNHGIKSSRDDDKDANGYPRSFMRKVLKLINTDEPKVKKKFFRVQENMNLGLLEEADWRVVETYKKIYESQAHNLEDSLKQLSEEEQAALFYLLSETELEELAAETKEKARKIKKAVEDAVEKDRMRRQHKQEEKKAGANGHRARGQPEFKETVSDYESSEEEKEEKHWQEDFQNGHTHYTDADKEQPQEDDYFTDEEGARFHRDDDAEELIRQDLEREAREHQKEIEVESDLKKLKVHAQEFYEGMPNREQGNRNLHDRARSRLEVRNGVDALALDTSKTAPTLLDHILELDGMEEGADLETMSFCSNSDVAEVEYAKWEELKENEYKVWETFYNTELTEHVTLDAFNEFSYSILNIPDQSYIDILSFFANESCFDSSFPAFGEVSTYFRQLETLMVNPTNQAKLLHMLTVAINCKPCKMNVPNLSRKIFSSFAINVLKFLQYYARVNPTSFFEYTPQDLNEFNSSLKDFLQPDVDIASLSQITECDLFNRILTVCPKELFRKDGLLRERVINLAAYLAKVAYRRKIRLTISPSGLSQLAKWIRGEHYWKSAPFQRRLGKLLRLFGMISSSHEVIFSLEKEFVEEKLPFLADVLTHKWEFGMELGLNKIKDMEVEVHNDNSLLQSLKPLQGAVSVFYCTELERFCSILKHFDYNLDERLNMENNFSSKLDTSEGAKTIIETVCNSLIKFKELLDRNHQWFSVLLPIVEPYVFCLIHIFRNQEDPVQLDKITSTLKTLINLVFDTSAKKISRDKALLANMSISFLRNLLELEVKEKIMRSYFNPGYSYRACPVVSIMVRRQDVLIDSIRIIEKNKIRLCKPYTKLRIAFSGEAGIDEGGLKKEWISILKDQIFDPRNGLFNLSNNLRCLYPSPQSFIVPNSLYLFRIAGNIIGLSIKENIPTGISFAKGFIKLILDLEATLEDLEELEPELVRSLQFLQENSITEDLGTSFTYEVEIFNHKKTLELVPNGQEVSLNNENKKSYIDLVLKTKLLHEIETQANEFKKGLFEIIPKYLIQHYLPYEFELLVCGQSEIELEDLKQSIQYKNCSPSEPLIQWFWEILENFTQQERISLLMFVTGSASIPYRGIKEFKITIIKTSKSPDHLPISHTCFSELELPNYNSKEVLQRKLNFVLREGKEGFYIA